MIFEIVNLIKNSIHGWHSDRLHWSLCRGYHRSFWCEKTWWRKAGGTVAVDQAIKAVIGKTVNELVGDRVKAVENLAKNAQEILEGGEELGEKLLQEQKVAEEKYKKTEKQTVENFTVSVDKFRMENQLATEQGLDSSLLIDVKKKESAKGISVIPKKTKTDLENGSQVKKLKELRSRSSQTNEII